MTKNCRRCGQPFSCGASQNACWCMNLPPVGSLPAVYQDCLCPSCLEHFRQNPISKSGDLIEGEDFYLENGFTVFTEKFLRDRGSCCNSGCRHCPYKNN